MSTDQFVSFTPELFGSTCFVHNNDPHKIKLDPCAFKSVSWIFMYSKGMCYYPKLNRFIISGESSRTSTLDLILLNPIKTFYILAQECSTDNTALLNILDQDTCLLKMENKTKVYARCTSIVAPSSVVPVSTSWSGKNILPSGDVTLVLFSTLALILTF